MSEMIERVAKALTERLRTQHPEAIQAGEVPTTLLSYAEASQLARAALEAMREPAADQLDTYCDPRNEAMKQAVAAEWRGMIGAALK